MENYLTVPTSSGPMDIYVAAPETHSKQAVIIVLQEAFGVNSHIKDICQRFSQEGYLAVAPELFHRSARHLQIDYTDRKAFLPLLGELSNDDLLADIDSTIDFLQDLPSADTSQIFTIGFCMGGFASLLAATKFDLSGSISYYGAGVSRAREGIGLMPFTDNFSEITCPLLLFFGAGDASINQEDREKMKKALDKNSLQYEMEVFPGCDHGFFCDARKTFNQAFASESWKKTLQWLKDIRNF
jgi:carboxymethylenebutenolidase